MHKVIFLDSGHGKDTPGKRSPDGSLMEWEYNREIAKRVQKILISYGWDTRFVVEDDWDMSLKQRYLKVNETCDKYGNENVIMISIHVNAAGNGDWKNARGWSVWTTRGQNQSDKLADELFTAAECYLLPLGLKVRKDVSDGDPDYESDFTVIYGTKCPSVLTENMFMDNKEDCAWLLTEEGKETITNIHVDGILTYMRKYWTE